MLGMLLSQSITFVLLQPTLREFGDRYTFMLKLRFYNFFVLDSTEHHHHADLFAPKGYRCSIVSVVQCKLRVKNYHFIQEFLCSEQKSMTVLNKLDFSRTKSLCFEGLTIAWYLMFPKAFQVIDSCDCLTALSLSCTGSIIDRLKASSLIKLHSLKLTKYQLNKNNINVLINQCTRDNCN